MDQRWLAKQFLTHPDKSKADLALWLKLPPSAISKMINGTRQIKATEFLAMRKFFGYDTDVKIKKDLTASTSPTAMLNDLSQEVLDSLKPKYDVVSIDDGEMLPYLKPHDRVLIDRNQIAPHHPALYAYQDHHKIFVRYVELDGAQDFIIRDTTGNGLIRVSRKDIKILGIVIAKLAAI